MVFGEEQSVGRSGLGGPDGERMESVEDVVVSAGSAVALSISSPSLWYVCVCMSKRECAYRLTTRKARER